MLFNLWSIKHKIFLFLNDTSCMSKRVIINTTGKDAQEETQYAKLD